MAEADAGLIGQSMLRYEPWLSDHEGLGVALCWTAARTSAGASVIMELISSDWVREGVVGLADLGEESYDDGSGREHVGWLIDTGEHVALLEVGGFGGSSYGVLRAWAAGVSSLAGMYWNVNLVNQIAVARDRQLATAELWAQGDISRESRLIARYQPFLTSAVDFRAFGLAVVEHETGLRLDAALLTRRWPLVRFAGRDSVGLAEGTPDD